MLTEWETRVRDAFESGTRVSPPAGERPAIRGSVLAGLLRSEGSPGRGLSLSGVTVTGTLNLEFADVPHPVRLQDCHFEEPPELSGATLRFVSFTGSRLPGLRASSAVVSGDLALIRCTVDGEIRLYGAKIADSLRMQNIRVSNPAGRAVLADYVTIGGYLSGTGGEFDGPVHLYHARCAGSVEFDDARIAAPGGVALAADSIIVDSALFARRSRIDGEIRLRHARISDALVLSGAALHNPGAVAARLDRATVDGGVFLSGGFSAQGEVRAVSSRIGRTLSLGDAEFSRPDGVALRLDAAVVDGLLDGRDNLRATGEFRLEDATVNGPIRLQGATLRNPDGVALNAAGLRAGSTLHCCAAFHAEGAVHLTYATVTTRVCFDKATLGALSLWRASAAELTLRWAAVPGGLVDLRHARIGVLRDDPRTWPAKIVLDGLTYEILEPLGAVDQRLDWLRREADGHRRQPYEQLAAVLRARGESDQARRVLLARQRRDTSRGTAFTKIWGFLQDATVGYGYRPQRAAAVFAALLVLGAVVFGLHPPPPAEAAKAPPFNALVYTLDLLLPLVDFGQQNSFNPRGAYQWISYVFVVAGLVLATTIAAGLSRSLRRT